MIRISNLKAFWDNFAQTNGIDLVVYVVVESQLADKIRDVTANTNFLVVVVPNSDTHGYNSNSVIEVNTCLVYALRKLDKSIIQEENNFVDYYGELQDLITLIKTTILELKNNETQSCSLFKGLDVNSMHTDPEYNYLGTYGWSLSFNTNTDFV